MAVENQPEPAAPAESVIPLPSHPDAPATDAGKSVPMPTPPDQPTRDRFRYVDWVLLTLVVALAFLVSSVPAYNADVWMQLATGKHMVAGQYLPGGAEPFSCATNAGAGHEATAWINHSWLYSLVLYLLYTAVGGASVIVIKATVVCLLIIVLALIRTLDTPRFIVAFCLTLTVLALSLRLLLQPVLVSYLFLGIMLLVLHRAGVWDTDGSLETAPDRSRWLWALPVLCLVWVNVDNWFILGPIVVGLSWVGVCLQRWRGWTSCVAPGRLALVLGACLLACLVNPFHVRAFQLPPELAYLLVRAGERVGVVLPDTIVAGGRTLTILQQDEPNLPITLSPFAPAYTKSPTLGYTIAGACFYPLLGLGVLSFLIIGLLSGRRGGPVLQRARFLVWLFFAVLACLLQRLIPFFAVVAGPMLALNLGELLAWCIGPATADGAPVAWVAPLRLARLAGVLVLVALIALAWPGWLAGPQEIGGWLHVGWDIPVNESLRRAAEQFGESAEAARGKAARVFSTGPDFACYCAYFAGPRKAKGFIDGRYSLFPHAAADFVKARRALRDNQRRPRSDWIQVFDAYRLSHAAVENFLSTPGYANWWAEPGRWRQQFADSATAVFAWSGEVPHWPANGVLDEWNCQAFGLVPIAERPPADGVPEPQNRTLLDRYMNRPLPLPQADLDLDVKLAYGQFITRRALDLAQLTLPGGGRQQVLPMYSLQLMPLQPGAVTGPWAMAGQCVTIQEYRNRGFLWAAFDASPPAVPILALRRAWQAASEAPDNERCYIHLANAVGTLQQQEDYWLRLHGPARPTLRAELRRVQYISALRAATEVGVQNPLLAYRLDLDLAQEHLKRHALDLSVTYLRLAEQALDAARPDEPLLQEDWDKERQQVSDQRKRIEAEVERRKSSFDVKTAGRKPLEKILQAAYGEYRFFTPENREQIDPQGWGLTGMTLQMLNDLSPSTLSPQEQLQWGHLSIDLMFKTGQARQASQLLTQFEEALGPLAVPLRVYRAGTQGNYRELASVLTERDDRLTAQESTWRQRALASCAALLAAPGPAAPTFSAGGTLVQWAEDITAWRLSANEAFSSKTLRGMIALEAGETAEAQRLLAAALRAAGNDLYAERAIAERYAAFLARWQPR